MILEIDAGNSAIKWRLVGADDGKPVARGVGEHHDAKLFLEIARQWPAISAAKIACVSSLAVKLGMCEQVAQCWNVESQVAETQKHFAGLTVAYENPARLGVDRWLAMLAAFKDAGQAVCVMDCGSAITVDLVDAQGHHQGGYIVPGMSMQRRVLVNDTGRIRLDAALEFAGGDWGCSTDQAVNSGIYRMAVGFIEGIIEEVHEHSKTTVFYITGGDAQKIVRSLTGKPGLNYRPELVMDGLAIALP